MTQFAETFSFYVHRSAYTPGQLAYLSGVPKMTIVNWLEGRVARPRTWQPLIKLLIALHLNEIEANDVLNAAGHPVIRQLRQEIPGSAAADLLVYWSEGETRPHRPPFQPIADVPLFVGRDSLLADLVAALRAPHHPAPYLLLGMAGMGKTTLAVHLAYRLRPHFTDGVLWARLALSDPMTILATFARAFGQVVDDYADLDSRGRVVRDLLADKRILLLLDDVANWEQVQPLLPPTGPGAVLLTSQQRAMAARPGVKTWEIPPFAAAESLRFFAGVGEPAWVSQHQTALQEVADRLGHWPLAVGLVAGRLASEPAWVAEQFLTQLRQANWPFPLADIQQRLGQTIALLLTRLSPSAQTLLPVLSLMGEHEFAEDAAAHLTQLPDPLLAVHELVSHTFLQRVRPGRLRWHPLVQQYIQAHFPPDETQINQFVTYSLALARTDAGQRLGMEQGHLTQTRQMVWGWGTVLGWRHWASFIVALWPYWQQRGLYRLIAAEVRERLAWLQAQIPADDPVWQAGGWGQVWLIRARLERFEHDYEAAAAALKAAWSFMEHDPVGQAEVWLERGIIASYQGDRGGAAAAFNEGMAFMAAHPHPQVMARLLKELGILALEVGQAELMKQYYRHALRLANQAHLRLDEIDLLRGLGTVAFLAGELAAAFGHYAQSLAQARLLDAREAMINGLNNLAAVMVQQGDLPQADRMLQEAAQLAGQVGHRQTMALLTANRGLWWWHKGDAAASRVHFQAAHQLLEPLPPGVMRRQVEWLLAQLDAAAPPPERLILFYD